MPRYRCDPQAERCEPGSFVSFLTPLPSAFIVYTPYSPSRFEMKEILRPSGDHELAPLFTFPPLLRVSCRSPLPSTLTT